MDVPYFPLPPGESKHMLMPWKLMQSVLSGIDFPQLGWGKVQLKKGSWHCWNVKNILYGNLASQTLASEHKEPDLPFFLTTRQADKTYKTEVFRHQMTDNSRQWKKNNKPGVSYECLSLLPEESFQGTAQAGRTQIESLWVRKQSLDFREA